MKYDYLVLDFNGTIIDDVILNTLGVFIGFGAFKILSRFSFFKNNIDL